MSEPLAPTRSRNQTQSIIWTPEEDLLLSTIMRTTSVSTWCSLLPHFPGKTAQQIAGRWEKVLNPSLVKGSWTREEDEKIVEFVRVNGARNWVKLAESLPGRIGKQCRERWTNHLSPEVRRTSWTEQEDQLLIELHQRYGNQWTTIASFMTGRTDNNVKNRWNSSLKRRIERINRGEPAFRKRGRKPKAPQVLPSSTSSGSDAHSECVSPIEEMKQGSVIYPFGSPLMMVLNQKGGEKNDAPQTSLEQNRHNLAMLISQTV